MKVMALDFGSKRVGVASTDDSGTFALPRMVLENDDKLIDEILAFKLKEGIDKVIIGESKNLDGTPNHIMLAVNDFMGRLQERGVDVELHPEVFTTMEARQIQGNTMMTDASAAAIILKSYLDKKHD